ncbi:hypothetical protein, partial [Plasmodium yoelii yoelii]
MYYTRMFNHEMKFKSQNMHPKRSI